MRQSTNKPYIQIFRRVDNLDSDVSGRCESFDELSTCHPSSQNVMVNPIKLWKCLAGLLMNAH